MARVSGVRRGWLVAAVLAVVVSCWPAAAAAAPRPRVLATTVDGTINPVVLDHLTDALRVAEDGDFAALVVRLDTPGGLLTTTREIVQLLLSADVPVVVYVAPPGARAGSAGAIITFAANVAAMAPGTNIGAATPIDTQGGDLGRKVVNDTAALVRAIAERRGRDADFIVQTVRTGRSAPADRAVALGAVDLVAEDLRDLLDRVDGRAVTLSPGQRATLDTGGASVERYELSGFRRLLQALADPQLAFLFISVGALALVYEFANPGGGLGGVLGVVMLVLAFYSLSVLPVNLAGVLLIILALGLFLAELFVPGLGVLAGGGAIALVVGGLFLFQGGTGVELDLSFLLPVALIVTLLAVGLGRLAWRSRHAPSYSGQGSSVVGERGRVRAADGEHAEVFAAGSLWRARAARGTLRHDDRVRVVGIEGLTLIVEREDPR
ncbi:MAG: nodulation protein NfeD [Actinobacteria bacterium]|nr:nodulation protein NfeD [Actinomycetota bacterium]